MKKLLIIITILTINITLMAQSGGMNFTVVPGINIFPNQENTLFSTGLISSEVINLNGMQVGPVYSICKENMRGVQIGGVYNIALDNSSGFQAGGVFNIGKEFDGFQAAGVFNISEYLDGFQASGVFNIAEDVDGFQAAGVFNKADDFDGFQVSGVTNVSDDFDGFQVAGVNNVSADLDGVQIAGVANVAQRVNGSQIGVINIASSGDNFQLGIINVVTEDSTDSVPVGLINLYTDGVVDVAVWMDSKDIFYQGLASGSKNFYTLFYTGSTSDDFYELNKRVFGTALGYRRDISLGYFDLTAGGKHMFLQDAYSQVTPEARATLGINVGAFAIFGGVSGMFKIDEYNNFSPMFDGLNSVEIRENVDMYYDWFVGVKLGLNKLW